MDETDVSQIAHGVPDAKLLSLRFDPIRHEPNGAPRVPGMFMHWEGVSPSANLMEVKASEAQGRHREVGSEGSV